MPPLATEMSTAELVLAYERDELSVAALADRCGRSTKWVYARLHDGGAKMRPARRRRRHVISRSQAASAYRQHKTTEAAAAHLGVPERVLVAALADAGVKRGNAGRPREEWPAGRIRAELDTHVAEQPTGHFPTRSELRAAGRYALLRALDRTGGASHWSDVVGLPVRPAGRRPAAT